MWGFGIREWGFERFLEKNGILWGEGYLGFWWVMLMFVLGWFCCDCRLG